MKKIILFGVCLSVLFINFISYQFKYKHVIDSAKLVSFSSAKDVKNNSELIVLVEKIGEEPVSYDLGNGLYDNFTISNVKIEKILKPMYGKELKEGDVINILESEWEEVGKRIIHHTENYSKMANNKKYTLYLGYNSNVDNYYPVGLLYGKVPVDAKEKKFYGDFKNNQIMSVVEELQKTP